MSADFFISFFWLFASLFLLLAGFAVGSITEAMHIRSMDEREDRIRHIILTNLKQIPKDMKIKSFRLVTGGAVISTDYFKTFITSLKKLFGGRLGAFESLLLRARREALIRLAERAVRTGSDVVVGIRYETSCISRNKTNNKGMTAVEVIAYGTALTLEKKRT